MRLVLAIISFSLAALMIGFGIAQRTVFAGPDHVTAAVATTSPESVALSKSLKAVGFAFVGPTTMHALMEATGIVDTHLVDSHRRGSSGVWEAAR